MREEIDRIFTLCGSTMELVQGGRSMEFPGFLQHFSGKTWLNIRRKMTPLGEAPRCRHELIAPYDTEVRVGDTVVQGGREYVVRRAEVVRFADEPLYCWGLCVEKEAGA